MSTHIELSKVENFVCVHIRMGIYHSIIYFKSTCKFCSSHWNFFLVISVYYSNCYIVLYCVIFLQIKIDATKYFLPFSYFWTFRLSPDFTTLTWVNQALSGICLITYAFQKYHSVFSIQNRLEGSQGCTERIFKTLLENSSQDMMEAWIKIFL